MVNGVDVNDNLFGNPQDCSSRTRLRRRRCSPPGSPPSTAASPAASSTPSPRAAATASPAASALNLTNPAWTDETPFEEENDVEREHDLNDDLRGHVRRADRPGPALVLRRRAPGEPRDSRDARPDRRPVRPARRQLARRGQAHRHASHAEPHAPGRLPEQPSTSRIAPSFPISIDPATLVDADDSRTGTPSATIAACCSNNLLAEAQFSERRFTFERHRRHAAPASSTRRSSRCSEDLGHYNAPYFDATDPEERNNRQFTGSVTYFARAARASTRSRRATSGSAARTPAATRSRRRGYVFDADYAHRCAGNRCSTPTAV